MALLGDAAGDGGAGEARKFKFELGPEFEDTTGSRGKLVKGGAGGGDAGGKYLGEELALDPVLTGVKLGYGGGGGEA